MRHEEAAEESNPSEKVQLAFQFSFCQLPTTYIVKRFYACTLGRTDGMYQVWFEDGRLMTVTYYVDGDSGFVPVITWEENHQPNFGG